MSSAGFRRIAVFVVLFGFWIAGFGIANLVSHVFGGTWFTVVALVGAASGLAGARECFLIASRLDRARSRVEAR